MTTWSGWHFKVTEDMRTRMSEEWQERGVALEQMLHALLEDRQRLDKDLREEHKQCNRELCDYERE